MLNKPFAASVALLAAVPFGGSTPGSLSENKIISSETLGYDLQYRVYLPDGYDNLSNLPVLFVTDGQWYIDQGRTADVMDELIQSGAIEPTIAVFIDNRNPHQLSDNRRNRQFFCNDDYIHFVTDELVTRIDSLYNTSATPDDRVMLGLSFGGLNSACFGLEAYETFGGIAMQSPATRPVGDLLPRYRRAPKRPIKIFLSTGTVNDNEGTSRRFRGILEDKGYELSYVEVPFGHNWRNWGPLIDDVLVFFFARESL